MTTPYLLADLRTDEGLRLSSYPDPDSPRGKACARPRAEWPPNWMDMSGDPWTIGYGHTGPEVRAGVTWTTGQAEAALQADANRACALLDEHMPWWRGLDDLRQDVLAEMTFNMGLGRLEGFVHALAAMKAGDWQTAHDQMLDSVWASQVGLRAKRLALQMLSGSRP